jgi:hypothetical protein
MQMRQSSWLTKGFPFATRKCVWFHEDEAEACRSHAVEKGSAHLPGWQDGLLERQPGELGGEALDQLLAKLVSAEITDHLQRARHPESLGRGHRRRRGAPHPRCTVRRPCRCWRLGIVAGNAADRLYVRFEDPSQ